MSSCGTASASRRPVAAAVDDVEPQRREAFLGRRAPVRSPASLGSTPENGRQSAVVMGDEFFRIEPDRRVEIRDGAQTRLPR
jgi:hypothetical protein